MSKPSLKILRSGIVFSVIAATAATVSAQTLKATIAVDKTRGVAAVNAEITEKMTDGPAPITKLSFEAQSIGAPRLGSRISKMELYGVRGEVLQYRRPHESEFVLERSEDADGKGIARFSYEVDLRPGADRRSAAHASWVTKGSGLLFFSDLLPLRFSAKARNVFLTLELPAGWSAATTMGKMSKTTMLWDASQDVALIGPQIRERTDKETTLATGDTWQFSDEKALSIATEIGEAYRKIFTRYPSSERHILLVRFPQLDVPKGTWEAETRGRAVILVSSDMAFESQAVQRLSEQFRHEIFHWWFPNGVTLTGKYDWFYEGFALYTSLKTGVALNQITFADYLDTLSRAHTIDNAANAGRLSLLEASAARFAGNETQVYARGMVAAFLCDLVLLRHSNGRQSVETVLRQLYTGRRYDAMPEEGNTAVLRVLGSYPELEPIIKEYIRGNNRVDLALAMAAGLETDPVSPVTKLRVAPKLTGSQKTLLDKLGYNSWRKLTRK